MANHCDFQKVPLDSSARNNCSPKIDDEDDFEGIAINAPAEIHVDNKGAFISAEEINLPVCGYYNISMAELMKNGVITIVLENIETNVKISGQVLQKDDSPEIPPPPDMPVSKPEDVANQYSGSYFNSNIPSYVRVPKVSSTYRLFVTLGNQKSNILNLKITSSIDS